MILYLKIIIFPSFNSMSSMRRFHFIVSIVTKIVAFIFTGLKKRARLHELILSMIVNLRSLLWTKHDTVIPVLHIDTMEGWHELLKIIL